MKYNKKTVAKIRKRQQIKKYKYAIKRYRENPVLFAEEMLGVKLYSWQKTYINLFSKIRKGEYQWKKINMRYIDFLQVGIK
jgi:hypothetical protein